MKKFVLLLYVFCFCVVCVVIVGVVLFVLCGGVDSDVLLL